MAGVRIEIPVAWGDMDAFGHVNNVVYLRWFESGRIAMFEHLAIGGPGASREHAPILARTTCEYLLPLTYPDTVEVTTTIDRIGTKSFTMGYSVWSRAHQGVAARGDGVIVWYDYASARSVVLSDELRDRLQAEHESSSSTP